MLRHLTCHSFLLVNIMGLCGFTRIFRILSFRIWPTIYYFHPWPRPQNDLWCVSRTSHLWSSVIDKIKEQWSAFTVYLFMHVLSLEVKCKLQGNTINCSTLLYWGLISCYFTEANKCSLLGAPEIFSKSYVSSTYERNFIYIFVILLVGGISNTQKSRLKQHTFVCLGKTKLKFRKK